MGNSFLSKAVQSFKEIIGPERTLAVNPVFETFTDVPPDYPEKVHPESIIERSAPGQDAAPGMKYESTSAYRELIYGRLSFDKPKRLRYYRNMAKFPEVADAIDEICDGCINYDENNNFVNLVFRDSPLTDEQEDSISKEFYKFISLYDIENDGWEMFRSLIRDGEVVFENLVDPKKKHLGIVGVKRIPPECFENLINIDYTIVGVLLNAKILYDRNRGYEMGAKDSQQQGTIGTISEIDAGSLRNRYESRGKSKLIPLPINQITYINTGQFNHDKTIVYPVLETARRPYRQLSLIEDAIIIYRLIRAPERLVFNVDTGKLPPAKAEQMVMQMMKRYQSKKIYDPSSGSIHNDYDPHQMLESYWFARPEGSQGTQVTPLQGGQNLGELQDLHYFLRKLYIALKVPFNRFADQPVSYEKAETISYEEYRFSKFVMRIQTQFAKGLYDAFITHLKLTGMWEKFKMNRRMILVRFTPPMSFELYEQQKLLNVKMENFNTATQNEMFSKDLAAIKYLGWNEETIRDNARALEKELIRNAYINRKAMNIEQFGNPHGPEIGAPGAEGMEGMPGMEGGLGAGGVPDLAGLPPAEGGVPAPPAEGGAPAPPAEGGEPPPETTAPPV
jgi:hypothetical protein